MNDLIGNKPNQVPLNAMLGTAAYIDVQDLPVSDATQEGLNTKEDSVALGTTTQYYRGDKSWQDLANAVRSTALIGLSTATNSAVTASDTVLVGVGKLQAQVTAHIGSRGSSHANATTTESGFISAADQVKLNGIAVGATANTGTVTSVSLSLPNIFTVTGSPVTAAGTLTATLASQTTKTFLAAPNAANGVPTFRAIIASDVPTLNQSTTGSAATLTTGRTIGMTGDVTWTSSAFNGSANVTGAATLANSGVTAGTYGKVTVDAKGRVTAGTSLAAGDIPTLTQYVQKSSTSAFLEMAQFGPRLYPSNDGSMAGVGDGWARSYGLSAGMASTNVAAIGAYGSGDSIGYVYINTTNDYASANSLRVYPNSAAWGTNTLLHAGNFNTYAPTLTGTGASGTWGISITGSAATLTTGRTIGMTGDVSWTSASFNGSVNVTGVATLANSGVAAGTYTKVTVDAKGRVTTGASLVAGDIPTLNQNTTGNAATVTNGVYTTGDQSIAGIKIFSGQIVQGVYRTQSINTVAPGAAAGAGRWFIRLYPVATAACFIGGRIRIGGAWSHAAIMGVLELEFGIYTAINATSVTSGSSRISAATGEARNSLRIGNIEVVDGWTGCYVWSLNTNSVGVLFDGYCQGVSLQMSSLAWEANALPAIRSVEFEGNITGLGVSTGTSFNSITGLSSATPLINGTAAVGTATNVAREDHVHPTDTTRAATNQTMFIGTTSVTINRASSALALTGITSIDGNAATVTNGVYLNNTQNITGLKYFDNDVYFSASTLWRVSTSNNALQRADARIDATNFSRLHWYGVTDTGVTSNFRHAWYDGTAYINITVASGTVTFGGIVAANSFTGSLTGNASTATELTNLTSTTTSNVGLDNAKSAVSYIGGMSVFAGVTDGALYSHVYSSSWKHQIYGDYRSGQIALRGKNSSVWQPWRIVLDSSNYNTYAPTLTGTGASGTWGISITGSAATLTTARSISVGASSKTFNGSGDIAFTASEMEVMPSKLWNAQVTIGTWSRICTTVVSALGGQYVFGIGHTRSSVVVNVSFQIYNNHNSGVGIFQIASGNYTQIQIRTIQVDANNVHVEILDNAVGTGLATYTVRCTSLDNSTVTPITTYTAGSGTASATLVTQSGGYKGDIIGNATNVTDVVAIANGGTGATTAAAARTNLGATTVGANLLTLTNPGAIAFFRANADNTVSALDAAAFRTAIGAGTSSTVGTVTSVGGTGTVSGLTLSGTVTTSGNLTLGGTLSVLPSNFASQTTKTFLAAPNAANGVPTFRTIVASDIPTLNQDTTGSSAICVNSNNTSIHNPVNSTFVLAAVSQTGALTITLPVVFSSTMLRFTVKVYNYNQNTSFEVVLAGYTYNASTTWINCSAYVVAHDLYDFNPTIRFGRDANNKPVVYIGETTTTWSYPQVYVTDIQLGYGGYNNAAWRSDWAISFSQTLATVQITLVNSRVGRGVSGNTASQLVRRDASGNFSAGTITATLSGNATSASTSTTRAMTDASTNIATTAFAKNLFVAETTTGTLDWNHSSNIMPGCSPVLLLGTATNGPGPAGNFYSMCFEYITNNGTGNLTQFAIPHANSQQMFMRGRVGGVWSAWIELLTNVNIANLAVTSVGLSLPSIFTVTGSPVTTTGTLTATLESQTANTFLAAPNGAAGAPTFRTIVASDIPTLNQSTTGNAATATRVPSTDSRAVNDTPETIPNGTKFDFKTNATVGLIDGGTYCGIMTFRPCSTGSDWTGGPVYQLGFTQNGNLWMRSATANGVASWSAWDKIISNKDINKSGSSSVTLGEGAYYNSTGTFNVAIGRYTLANGSIGNNNTAIGDSAAYSNTTGTGNSAIGRLALYNNTTGTDNSAFGLTAAFNNIGGSFITAVGSNALYSNTTGNGNTAVGYQSMLLNTTGRLNCAFGHNSLDANTTGIELSAFGAGALSSNTTANFNSAFGASALFANTTGTSNSAFGHVALGSNTTGNYNVAIGRYALSASSTSSDNTAVGSDSLRSNTTGSSNTSVGSAALRTSTTASHNTAVGSNALYSNSTGAFNTSVGSSALYANTIGVGNSALGYSALNANTTGVSNTAIGSDSLKLITTTSNNTGVGHQTLGLSTTGANNTAIGSWALNSVTSGTNNFAIGHYSGTDALINLTTESNRGVLGNNDTTNIYSKVSITVLSDIRDKTEIQPLELGLDFVKQVNPISYRYKLDRDTSIGTGDVQLGFSAQELLSIQGHTPVVDDEHPDKLKLVKDNLIAILFNAVKELASIVENKDTHEHISIEKNTNIGYCTTNNGKVSIVQNDVILAQSVSIYKLMNPLVNNKTVVSVNLSDASDEMLFNYDIRHSCHDGYIKIAIKNVSNSPLMDSIDINYSLIN